MVDYESGGGTKTFSGPGSGMERSCFLIVVTVSCSSPCPTSRVRLERDMRVNYVLWMVSL